MLLKKIIFILFILGSASCNNSAKKKEENKYFNTATEKIRKGDRQGAIDDYNKIIEINPNNANAYYEIGYSYEKLNDYDGGITYYLKAMELDSAKYAFLIYSIISLKERKFEKETPKKYNYLENYPNEEWQNYYRELILDYNTALKYNTQPGNAYFGRGRIKMELGDKIGALLDFDKLIEFAPNFDLGYLWRGSLRISMGQKEQGCLDLSKAGELGSKAAYRKIRESCN